MATQILMPALSPTMTEGKLAKWLKKVGEPVRAGDVIAEIETDKATMEVEAVDEGQLTEILVDEGTEGVAVNTPIAILAADGEEAPAPQAAPQPVQAKAPEPVPVAKPVAAPVAAEAAPEQGCGRRPSPSPCARRCATRWRLETARATTTCVPAGRGGRAVPGRLQDQPGPAGRVRPAPDHRHADHRARLHRHGGRCGDERAAADRGVHDVQLRHAGDRPDHQFGGQDAVHVGRPDGVSHRLPRPERRRQHASAPSTASAMPAGTRMCRA